MLRVRSLGRVAVVDRGEGARRALRCVREMVRGGTAAVGVALYDPRDRQARFVLEADESVERETTWEDALRIAGVDVAWFGRGSLGDRAQFAEACARAHVAFVGPSADALRALAAPGALARIASQLQMPVAGAPSRGAHVVEAVVACDAAGARQVIATGEVSLRDDAIGGIVECPAAALSIGDAGAVADAALVAAEAAGWTGLCAVRFHFSDDVLALAAIDGDVQCAAALEAACDLDLVRLALDLTRGATVEAAERGPRVHAIAAHVVLDPESAAGSSRPAAVLLRLPSGPGLQTLSSLEHGDVLPADDSSVATLVATAPARGEALTRLQQALADSDILLRGGSTSQAALVALCDRAEVRAGDAGGDFLSTAEARERLVTPRTEDALLATAVYAYDAQLDLERARFLAEARRGRPRVGPSSGRIVELRHGALRHRLEVRQTGPETYRISAGASSAEAHVARLGPMERRFVSNGRRFRVLSAADGLRNDLLVDGVPHTIFREPAGLVTSPMPAVVVAISVEPGQRVDAGDPVARIESMKVEVEVRASEAGVVREVVAIPNSQIDAGDPLVRLEPLGDAAAAGEPLSFGAPAAPEASAPTERYVEALDHLGRLLLGFDVAAAEARRLGSRWRELAAAVPGDQGEVIAGEDWALRAFADVQALFSKTRLRGSEPGAKPPLEELWRFLHEPEKQGEGLDPTFVSLLERALSHYEVSLTAPGRDLELALLRLQKAYERVEDQLAPILGILDRRLTIEGADRGLSEPDARELLERLTDVGQERFTPLADLARELRYRRFDQPALERVRAEMYARAEADLEQLEAAPPPQREAIVSHLVAVPHPIATLLIGRMASEPRLRLPLVETLMRRYYRFRPLEQIASFTADGFSCASAEFELEGRRLRLVTCFAPSGAVADAARALGRVSAQVPAELDLTVELYLWDEQPPATADEHATSLQAVLAAAGFARPVRRASFVLAHAGRGVGTEASQQHFTFRGGPAGWSEDRVYRGVHPMLFRRMQLARLSRFELERLPAVEDVYLYRGVARNNPKDERLFAAAEVRDVTPVRDARGRVIQLPHLERILLEALAGMRRFQARRAAHQRLEWNRVMLTISPTLRISRDDVRTLAERLAPATEGLGLEMIVIHASVVEDGAEAAPTETLIRVLTIEGGGVNVRWDPPTDRPLEPMAEYQQRVVQLRRRGLTHPFEIVRMLAPNEATDGGTPRGTFVEHDVNEAGELVPVDRPPGGNVANIVAGVVTSFTDRYPEGMRRVALLSDPSRMMGSLAEPECRRIAAAIALAERLGVPLEWFAVSAGAKIAMESGTENMDWISLVLRRIIEFTQRGGEINIVVTGITVGGQPYWNAEATMLMHTRGILVMTRGSSMVLTGKEALQYSGSVSAEDNEGIGGYDRIMGPNGQAQYQAASIADAIDILMQHYDHSYVLPGERFPRQARTADPRERDVRDAPHGPVGGAGFVTVGDVFSAEHNPDRKKPFDIRRVMSACIDQDLPPLERWRDLRGGETAVVWDAHLGGWPVCLIGIESRPLPRSEFAPADGPDFWSAGTLFPNSSKKIARSINATSGRQPLVVLANLSGFDGSPESMRRLQLEYGAEIGRAVVNFRGPIVFCVVSRYHGGAFVVFSKALRDDIEVVAVEGARASVIGGAPAAAVVFAREVDTRTRKDPRVAEAERAAGTSGAAKARLADVVALVRSEKVGEVADEFDAVHTVERALRVGSLDRIIAPAELRPYLIGAVERGMDRIAARAAGGGAS